jgi:hypothetical protein
LSPGHSGDLLPMSFFKPGVAQDLDHRDILLEIDNILGNFVDEFVTTGVGLREDVDQLLALREHALSLSFNLFRVQFEDNLLSGPDLLVGLEVPDQAPKLLIRLDISLSVQ